MGLGDLALFAAGGGFGDSGGFGAACGFDTLGCCGTGGFFGFAQSTAHGGVGIVCLMGAGGLGCVTRGGICCSGGSFGFGLSQQRLLAHLLGCTMSELRAILAARGGEIAILCSVKIRPGVEDRYIFRGLRHCRIIDPVCAARIHILVPVLPVTVLILFECAGSLPVENDVFAPVSCNSLRLLWALLQVNETVVRLKCDGARARGIAP